MKPVFVRSGTSNLSVIVIPDVLLTFFGALHASKYFTHVPVGQWPFTKCYLPFRRLWEYLKPYILCLPQNNSIESSFTGYLYYLCTASNIVKWHILFVSDVLFHQHRPYSSFIAEPNPPYEYPNVKACLGTEAQVCDLVVSCVVVLVCPKCGNGNK